jgi:hypothetical protein
MLAARLPWAPTLGGRLSSCAKAGAPAVLDRTWPKDPPFIPKEKGSLRPINRRTTNRKARNWRKLNSRGHGAKPNRLVNSRSEQNPQAQEHIGSKRPNICFNTLFFQMVNASRGAMPTQAMIPSPGSWFVNALAPSAKGVENIFFQLSSGAIKKSRRLNFPGSQGPIRKVSNFSGPCFAARSKNRAAFKFLNRLYDRQCWAIVIVPGSTFTPGPMVEDTATRCR